MRTSFFNVGHGETIFIDLSDDNVNRGIIRDYGRHNNAIDTPTSLTIDDLTNKSNYCFSCLRLGYKNDVVLSHAHDDHFNGFRELYEKGERNIFENAFIPWLPIKDLNDLGGRLIKYSILLCKYYDINTITATNARNWLIAAPVMAGLSRSLYGVIAGHRVPHWKIQNKFLWPLPNEQNKIDIRFNYFLENYIKINNLDDDLLNQLAARIIKVLFPFYQDYSEEIRAKELGQDESGKAIDIINAVLIESKNEPRLNMITSPLLLSNYSFKPNIDNHSLMFEIGEAGDESLFLSDANESTIKKMLEHNKIKDKEYRLIKSGHHGNRGANALDLKKIKSKSVINCCGPSHPNYKGPDSNYEKVSANLECTDWNDNNHNWLYKSKYCISKSCCIRK